MAIINKSIIQAQLNGKYILGKLLPEEKSNIVTLLSLNKYMLYRQYCGKNLKFRSQRVRLESSFASSFLYDLEQVT